MRALLNFVFALGLAFTITSGHASDVKIIEHDLSDAMITTKITSKFTENKDLNPLKIGVSTTHGTVTLTGHVKDKAALVDALRLAKATHGVKSIDAEDLDVKQVNTSFTDAYITAKVEGAVLKAKVLDDESIPLVGINATTNNGVVTLSGEVRSSQSIAPLLKRVHAVRGVKKVVSRLHVVKQAS
jgi:hyperosmotically inducible periplasmic protein